MTPDIAVLNRIAVAWAGLAWALAWQSTLVVAAFALVALGLRRSAPGLRYWLWQMAAIKLLLMPLWGVSVALPAIVPPDAAAGPTARSPARSGDAIGARPVGLPRMSGPGATADASPRHDRGMRPWIARVDWRGWLFAGWGLAVACQVAAIAQRRTLLVRLLRRATLAGAEDPGLAALVAELSARIGLRCPPEVLIVDGEGSPFVCGLRHPALVLPRGLAHALGRDPLRSVLLHELAHIRRRDLLWDWIPTIARVLYVFHPAAHYLAYRARLERELACDQAAMVLTGVGAAGYASTLVAVVTRSSAIDVVPPFSPSPSEE